eukprot:gene23345-biopygen975
MKSIPYLQLPHDAFDVEILRLKKHAAPGHGRVDDQLSVAQVVQNGGEVLRITVENIRRVGVAEGRQSPAGKHQVHELDYCRGALWQASEMAPILGAISEACQRAPRQHTIFSLREGGVPQLSVRSKLSWSIVYAQLKFGYSKTQFKLPQPTVECCERQSITISDFLSSTHPRAGRVLVEHHKKQTLHICAQGRSCGLKQLAIHQEVYPVRLDVVGAG